MGICHTVYDSEAEVTKKYRIYEDEDDPFLLGYTYDSWIPREKYEKLSVTRKAAGTPAGGSP